MRCQLGRAVSQWRDRAGGRGSVGEKRRSAGDGLRIAGEERGTRLGGASGVGETALGRRLCAARGRSLAARGEGVGAHVGRERGAREGHVDDRLLSRGRLKSLADVWVECWRKVAGQRGHVVRSCNPDKLEHVTSTR